MKNSEQTFLALETAFRQGDFKPLYLFYGAETFFMDGLQDLLLSCALQPHERDFNYDLVYGADSDAAAVLGICSAYPMMAPRRIVVVRGFELLKDNSKFARYAARPNPAAVVLLICSGRPRMLAEPYRALKRLAATAEFRPLYESEVPGFVARRLRKEGCAASSEATQMLADYVGTSLHSVVNEIDKVLTYLGERRELTREDVIQASGQTRECNIFELQRALGEGRKEDVHRIGERIVGAASNKRGEALRMVYMLYAYVVKLWKLQGIQGKQLSANELAKQIGVSPYFLREYRGALRRASPSALELAFASLLAADHELKGGSRRDERLVVTLLLRRLLLAFSR